MVIVTDYSFPEMPVIEPEERASHPVAKATKKNWYKDCVFVFAPKTLSVTDFLLDGFADLAWHDLDILHHNVHANLLWDTSAVLLIRHHHLILLKWLAHFVLASGLEVDGFPTDAFFLPIWPYGALRASTLQLSFRHLFAGRHSCAFLHKPCFAF